MAKNRPSWAGSYREIAAEMGRSHVYVSELVRKGLFSITRLPGSRTALLDRRQLRALGYLPETAQIDAEQIRRDRDIACAAKIMRRADDPELSERERNLLRSPVADLPPSHGLEQ